MNTAACAAETTADVILSKVDEKHLRSVLGDLDIKAGKKEPVASLVRKLSAHYAKTLKESDEGDCDNCKGVSDLALDACAYCGHKDGDPLPGATQSNGSAHSETVTMVLAASAPKDDLVPSSQVLTERTLDAAVAEVHQLKGQAASSVWVLGGKIKTIYDHLWQLRKDPSTGKPRYKGFEAFCIQELLITPASARSYMDLHANFTAEQVAAFGSHKLTLVLTAPTDAQPALLERAAEVSSRDLQAEVRRIKEEAGDHRRPNRDSGVVQDGSGAGRKPREEKVTVASILGRHTVKLFKKPTTKKFDPAALVRCKEIADVPWGVFEMVNGVRQTFEVRENAAGELELVVVSQRVEK